MEQRLSLITLGVADLALARRFYEQGLGWNRGNTDDDVAFYQLNGLIVGLWPRVDLAADARMPDTGASFSGITLAFNTRSHAEVDEVLAQAAAAGGTVLKPAEEAPWGGYSGYFADVDGHPWEVAWNPGWSIDGAGRVSLAPA
ncbi:VOC family protein [Aeromicrobium sp.]|uniref:VOC family protein n=1 Tax=Aeromicrobium sp. TaxID=1871063 RepID=UPI0019AC0637|nr:VOC family protein [Aeromicrobium sp.]MBC7631485.1 VOC family protein [Aeromicrobium sp.]